MAGEVGSGGDTEDMLANLKNSQCVETPGPAPRRANNQAVSRYLCLLLVFFICLSGADAWLTSLLGILEGSEVSIIKLRLKAASVYSLSSTSGPWGQSAHPSLQTTRLRLKNLTPHSHQVSGLGLEPIFARVHFSSTLPCHNSNGR